MYHELDTYFLVVTGKSSVADLVTTFGLYAFLCYILNRFILSKYKYILFYELFIFHNILWNRIFMIS